MKTLLGSGILPIAVDTKHLCLVWRAPGIRQGNRWGLMGGMVKEGLTVQEGALLEMKEEVGYTGPISLHKASVQRRKGFAYHSFVGIVPGAFPFEPEPEFAHETSFISWMPYPQIVYMMKSDPHTFHEGLLELFSTTKSKNVIESLL